MKLNLFVLRFCGTKYFLLQYTRSAADLEHLNDEDCVETERDGTDVAQALHVSQ